MSATTVASRKATTPLPTKNHAGSDMIPQASSLREGSEIGCADSTKPDSIP
jgi:hypothetical protein